MKLNNLFFFFSLFLTITISYPTSEKYTLNKLLQVITELDGRRIHINLQRKFFNYALAQNKTLKSSDPDCFDRQALRNRKQAREKIIKLGGIPQIIQINPSQSIFCTFVNRNSNKLLVLGGGFPVFPREGMLPFLKLFPNYDILLFDYLGVGSDYHPNPYSYVVPWKLKGALGWHAAGVDTNVSTIGQTSEHEVITVVTAYKQKKHYDQVIGLGLCFSAYTFAKAATQKPTLFNKLIFDGCWPSIERVLKKNIQDPSIICSKENPHSPFPWLTHQEWFATGTMKLIEWLSWTNLHQPLLIDFLPHLKCPVLFIQCHNDCYCTDKEFEDIFNAIKTPKIAVLTKNIHGRNNIYQPEAYKELATAFIEKDFDEYVQWINNYDEIYNH